MFIGDLFNKKKLNESLRDGEYYTFQVFFDDGTDETLNFSSDDIDWDRVGAKRGKKVVDVKRQGGIQGSQTDTPRKPHDFPDDRGLARAQRAYDRQMPEGVMEAHGPYGKIKPGDLEKIQKAKEREKKNAPGQLRRALPPSKKRYRDSSIEYFAKLDEQDVEEGSVQDRLHRRHQALRKKSGLPDPEYYRELKASYNIENDSERLARQAEIKKKYLVAEGVTSPEIKQAYADIMKTKPHTPERKAAVKKYQALRADALDKKRQDVAEAAGLYGPFTVTINTGERPTSRTKTKKFRREDDAILWAEDWFEDFPQYVYATAEITDPEGNVVWYSDETMASGQGVAEGAGRSFLELVDDFLVDYTGSQSGDSYTWTDGKKVIEVEMDPNDPGTVYWALGIAGRSGKTNWVESGSDNPKDALRVVKNFAKNPLAEAVEVVGQDYDLDQMVFTLNVDGKKISFTYWDYEEDFANADINEIRTQVAEQLGKLSEQQQEQVAQAVYTALHQNLDEAGPFSYGAKKPRKGSVADLAAKKRQEQERGKQPIEPRDQMVGTARVVTNEDIANYLEEMTRAGYDIVTEAATLCPECGGPAYSNQMLAEKQDACYHKVKSRYKVWPSAYASGALVRCRKVGAKNWGNKSKK